MATYVTFVAAQGFWPLLPGVYSCFRKKAYARIVTYAPFGLCCRVTANILDYHKVTLVTLRNA